MQILRIKHEKARAGDGYDSQRVSLLPDIPTARETGFPSLEVEGLVRLFGPRVLAGEVGARLKATAQVPNTGWPAEFAPQSRRSAPRPPPLRRRSASSRNNNQRKPAR
jgi:Tripartite tricarboxylate transporter family receptor